MVNDKSKLINYNGDSYLINNFYPYSLKRIKNLIDTVNEAKSEYGDVLAIRIDFGISTKLNPDDMYLFDIDLDTCYSLLLDRVRKHLDRRNIKHKRNWKLEYSKEKGLHLHTVYYFDYAAMQGFSLSSELYEYVKESWLDITNGYGVINLVGSCLADNFNKSGIPNKSTSKSEKQYSTLITDNQSTLDKLRCSDIRYNYLKQKNKQDEPYGFIHWISYFAKETQKANRRKCFG